MLAPSQASPVLFAAGSTTGPHPVGRGERESGTALHRCPLKDQGKSSQVSRRVGPADCRAACRGWALRDPARIEEYRAGHGRSLSSGAATLFHLLGGQPAGRCSRWQPCPSCWRRSTTRRGTEYRTHGPQILDVPALRCRVRVPRHGGLCGGDPAAVLAVARPPDIPHRHSTHQSATSDTTIHCSRSCRSRAPLLKFLQ